LPFEFQFPRRCSYPEELVAEAARLELGALALTDHDGLYGVVRFAEAGKGGGVLTVFGAELTLAGRGPDLAGAPVVPAAPRTGTPDRPGSTWSSSPATGGLFSPCSRHQ